MKIKKWFNSIFHKTKSDEKMNSSMFNNFKKHKNEISLLEGHGGHGKCYSSVETYINEKLKNE